MADRFFTDHCPNCGFLIDVRTSEQNGALFAVCSDLSRGRDWPRGSGVYITPKAWKQLLIAAWERVEGRPAEFYPALDGQGFDVVYRRSSRLSSAESSELIEFATAWAAIEGVPRRERRRAA